MWSYSSSCLRGGLYGALLTRPTISAVLLGATPQIKLPSSKTKIANRNVHLIGKYFKALPQVLWKAAVVRKKAEPYQPTSFSEWNSSVIRGMAVATIVMSRAKRKMARPIATRMGMSFIGLGYMLLSTCSRAAPSCGSSSACFSSSRFSLLL